MRRQQGGGRSPPRSRTTGATPSASRCSFSGRRDKLTGWPLFTSRWPPTCSAPPEQSASIPHREGRPYPAVVALQLATSIPSIIDTGRLIARGPTAQTSAAGPEADRPTSTVSGSRSPPADGLGGSRSARPLSPGLALIDDEHDLADGATGEGGERVADLIEGEGL